MLSFDMHNIMLIIIMHITIEAGLACMRSSTRLACTLFNTADPS
jgi:hypothetical protein